MRNALIAAILLGITGAAGAAEFSDLAIRAKDLKGAAEIAVPSVPKDVSKATAAVSRSGPERASAAQGYAEGSLYQYDKNTKQYSIPLGGKCSISLSNFKSYLDTEHGSPRKLLSADYRLAGFPREASSHLSGTVTGLPPTEWHTYLGMDKFYEGFGLASGTRVELDINTAPTVEALLGNPITIREARVYSENSANTYFGGNGMKWGYLCKIK